MRTPSLLRAVAIAVAAVVALGAACGGGDPDISGDASSALEPKVAEIRQLAAARQAEQAKAKLAELRGAVEELRSSGDLSDQRAGEILLAADAVETRLALVTTTTIPPPPPDEDEDDEDRGRGKGDKDDD